MAKRNSHYSGNCQSMTDIRETSSSNISITTGYSNNLPILIHYTCPKDHFCHFCCRYLTWLSILPFGTDQHSITTRTSSFNISSKSYYYETTNIPIDRGQRDLSNGIPFEGIGTVVTEITAVFANLVHPTIPKIGGDMYNVMEGKNGVFAPRGIYVARDS